MDEFSPLLDLGLSILCFGAIGYKVIITAFNSPVSDCIRGVTGGWSELGCLADALLCHNNVGFSHSPGCVVCGLVPRS